MSQTFTLTGKSSILSVDFYPPIELDDRYNYSVALIGFHTYNSIPNIQEGNNKFYYTVEGEGDKVIIIPTGSFEISDLENYLQLQLSPANSNYNIRENYLSLKPNNNTLKSELKCKYEVNFYPTDSIGKLLGFSPKILKKDTLHESDLPVNIVQVSTIRIECNIATGSYYNNLSSHTIYELTPTVDPGYSIDVEPRNLTFLPIDNRRSIGNITIKIVDQNSQLINFRGEEIIVRLELRKQNGIGIS